AGRTAIDVGDQRGAGGSAVTAPELLAVHPIVGREQRRVAEGDELDEERERAAGWVDVGDQTRVRLAAAAGPELDAVHPVVGAEQYGAVQVGERRRRAAVRRAVAPQVGQHDGAGFAPIADPRLDAVGAVVGAEQQPIAGGGELGWVRARETRVDV